jgi:hypothetical protein
MAITNDPRPSLTKRKAALEARVSALESAAGSGSGGATFDTVGNDGAFDQVAFDAAIAQATKPEYVRS